ELSTLIDRLSNRLGREAVTRPLLVPDPQPEYAYRFQPVIQTETNRAKRRTDLFHLLERAGDSPDASPGVRCLRRPLRLWARPQRIDVVRVVPGGPPRKFCWAGTDYYVTRTWGPERIETGWWRGEDVHRDYYMVTTDAGARFWLYLHHDDNRWLLHG